MSIVYNDYAAVDREHVWTLNRAWRQASCELKSRGGYGIEARFYLDDAFLASQRFESKTLALQWAARKRRDLERDGWRVD